MATAASPSSERLMHVNWFELWRPRCPANEALRMCLPCFKKNRLPGFPSLNNSAKVNVFRGQQRNVAVKVLNVIPIEESPEKITGL